MTDSSSASTSAPRPARPRSSTPTGSRWRTARRRRRGSRCRPAREVDPDALLAAVAQRRGRGDRAARPRAAWPASASPAWPRPGCCSTPTGRVLHPPIAWHDARGMAEAQALARDLPDFSERTGLPASALCSLAKLKHLGIARRAARWLNVAEWIVHRLGGRQVSELSLSSRTGLLDLDRPRALRRRARLGRPARRPARRGRSSPAPTRGAATARPLPGTAGAVLTVAGHDHVVAGLGVGVDRARRRARLVRHRRGDRARGPAARRRGAPAQRRGRRDRRLARGRRTPGAAGGAVVGPRPARGARRSRDRRVRSRRAQRGRTRHRSRRRARARARAALARALAGAPARRRARRRVARRDRSGRAARSTR